MRISTKAMIKKDMKTFYLNKQVLIMLIVLPLLFCLFYPIIISSIISFGSEESFSELMADLGIGANFTREDAIKKVYSMILMFVLLIPLMLGNLLGSAIVTNEKESRTLETILYSPLTSTEFFQAKLLSTLIPGIAVSFLSGLLCFASISVVSFIGLHRFIIPSAFFISGILIFGPSMLFLMLTLTLKMSSKSETSVQAQQKTAFIAVPFILIIFILISFLSALNDLIGSLALIGSSILILLIAILLFNNTIQKMTPERLIK